MSIRGKESETLDNSEDGLVLRLAHFACDVSLISGIGFAAEVNHIVCVYLLCPVTTRIVVFIGEP
jgi:hypothetical protein